ncbi:MULTISPECIES: M15 family metallopeptidase [unclassified Streptomyces]|uniref:M15 family metallopeptidase n=1 Tax=unclassified Streptomyces TaxID=2593676 RepID=UPI002E109858|nr:MULTISPECIES: M15 family metallopeptidase [unclassified Streptomyces]WSR24937.1 M15 family metallopeptidase [Streptomyces sp. NBC_01205]
MRVLGVAGVAWVVGCAALLGGGAGPDAGARSAPRAFVALTEVDPTVGQDIRYATAHNFTGAVVDGYEEPVCLLARPAAEALRAAQRELLPRGYSLTVYDCYRPQRAVDRFVRWAADGQDQATKAEFYPDVDKARLIPDGYIAEKSGHSRGSTVDVTLVRLPLRRPVDMGTAFDRFDPLSHTDAPGIAEAARANRDLLRGALSAQGFVNLPEEWWHFTFEPEAFADSSFDFPVAVASVRP